MQCHCTWDGLGENEEWRSEGLSGISRLGCGMKKLSESYEFPRFGGGICEVVGDVGDSRIFQAYDQADDSRVFLNSELCFS